MRLTSIICTVNLILCALFGGVYAFTGFNLLAILCLYNGAAERSFLAICAVSALFEIYLLLVFKPFKGMK